MLELQGMSATATRLSPEGEQLVGGLLPDALECEGKKERWELNIPDPRTGLERENVRKSLD